MQRWAFTDDQHEYQESETKPPVRACDFCGRREVFHVYPTADHCLPDPGPPGVLPVMMSSEGWAACIRCARLIDAERWDRLLERATDEFIRNHPEAAARRAGLRASTGSL